MKLLSLTMLAALATTSAQAAIFDPAPVKVTNGFSIVPQLDTSVSYNDNIYTKEDDLVSSMITISKPSFIFGTDDGINHYGGEYELVAGFYSEDSDNNYVDHNLTLTAHTEFTDKHRTDFNMGFSNLHEDRGSNLSESSDYKDEPYKYNTYLGKAYYQYGVESALINVGGGLQYYAKEYQNYTDTTDAYDYSTWTLMLDSDYQVGDVTYLTAGLSMADTVYSEDESKAKDNTNSMVYLGVRWEGTGKTVGEIKLGYQYKDFDDDGVDDFNGVNTDIGIAWKPLQRSNFEWHVIRKTEESYNVGDYVLVLASSLEWTHDWSNKFSSDISLIYSNEDYVNSVYDREDDVITASLDLNYDFTRWLTMTAGYTYADTDSTSTYVDTSGIIYTQNVVSLGVTVAL